jgi:ribosome recycling factor
LHQSIPGTEDQKRDFENKVQKTTDIYIETIDEIVVSKLKDLSE